MRRILNLIALAGVLALAPPTWGATPEIKDDGGFFSAEAVKKANADIGEIARLYKKDVVVETFASVPDGRADEVRKMTPEARGQFFSDWLRQRARASRTDGVHILLCKDPAHLKVGMGADTAKRAFTAANRDELGRMFLEHMKKKDYDSGLLASVAYIKKAIQRRTSFPADNEGAAAVAQEHGRSSIWRWVFIGLAVFLGIWLISGLFRALSGGGGTGGYGGGGGGFMSGLLGGLFGAVAGNWLYHSFFGPSAGHSPVESSSPIDAGDSPGDQGEDFSTSGGDFGDSAGGDFGGGDFGGGDFGGGDFGGGGDF